MRIVLEQFADFMSSLDWVYIFSFIILTHTMNYYKVPELIGKGIGVSIRNRYQVLIFGVVYAILIFFVRGYDSSKILSLTISFCIATVFHKFLMQMLLDRFLPRKKKEVQKDEFL